jgi:hypothetical protein
VDSSENKKNVDEGRMDDLRMDLRNEKGGYYRKINKGGNKPVKKYSLRDKV